MKKVAAVIFAGGRGIRLGDTFGNVPKALVQIDGKAIIEYLINHLSNYGINEIFVLTGYRSDLIRQYFIDLSNTDHVEIDFKNQTVTPMGQPRNWRINVINTGLNATTQSRLYQIKDLLKKYEDVLITYADGISDVNLNELYNFHKKNDFHATITAVTVNSKYGDLKLNNHLISNFSEKGFIEDRWINGGFIFTKTEALQDLEDSYEMFEEDFLPKCSSLEKLGAFKHRGFWKAMDTPKDHAELEELAAKKELVFGNEFKK